MIELISLQLFRDISIEIFRFRQNTKNKLMYLYRAIEKRNHHV